MTTQTQTAFSAALTKEQRTAIITAFKARARAKQVTAVDMIVYNLIRGLSPCRGFTPISNANKLVSSANDEYFQYHQARQRLDYVLYNLRKCNDVLELHAALVNMSGLQTAQTLLAYGPSLAFVLYHHLEAARTALRG